MQSFGERRKLMEAYGEWRGAASVVAACGAGFLFIGVLALAWFFPGDERPEGQRLEQRARPAEAHRKQVFDERRSRYEERSESRDVAERGPVERAPLSAQEERGL